MKLYTEEQIRMLDINLEGTTIDEVINCLTPIYITTRTMEQTAVEWLIDQLVTGNEVTLKGENYKLFDQAKEMEKEQIKSAFTKGDLFAEDYFYPEKPNVDCSENYYKETYESKNKN